MGRKKWTRTYILEGMRKRLDKGQAINLGEIGADDKSLFRAIRHQRGGWSCLIRELGEDPDRWSGCCRWTKESFLKRLKRRKASGPISYGLLRVEGSQLPRAAVRLFGSWHAAMNAVGLPKLAGRDPKQRRHWTPQMVREAIVERRCRGLKVNSKNVQKTFRTLYDAGIKFFGTWPNVLNGDAYPTHEPRTPHTAQSIIEAILTRQQGGQPISATGMRPYKIFVAGVRIFGNWANALIAAGLDPELFRVRRKWSPEKIITAIQTRMKSGNPMNASSLHRGPAKDCHLYYAAVFHFNSWRDALLAADLDPSSLKIRTPWNPDKVLKSLRAWARRRKKFNYSTLRLMNSGLAIACCRHFGSWNSAIQAAGLTSKQISYHKKWTRTEVINALRECEEAQRPFKLLPVSIRNSAKRLYGSWHAALQTAFGFRYNMLKHYAMPRGKSSSKLK